MTKIEIYKTIPRPIIMYGCERWILTERNGGKLRCFRRKTLRLICGPVRDTTTENYTWRKNQSWKTYIRMRRFSRKWNPATKLIWTENWTGKRQWSRPRLRWPGNVVSDFRTMGYTYQSQMTGMKANCKRCQDPHRVVELDRDCSHGIFHMLLILLNTSVEKPFARIADVSL